MIVAVSTLSWFSAVAGAAGLLGGGGSFLTLRQQRRNSDADADAKLVQIAADVTTQIRADNTALRDEVGKMREENQRLWVTIAKLESGARDAVIQAAKASRHADRCDEELRHALARILALEKTATDAKIAAQAVQVDINTKAISDLKSLERTGSGLLDTPVTISLVPPPPDETMKQPYEQETSP